MIFRDLAEAVLGLPKTIYVNFKLFPPGKAAGLPILVSPYVKLGKIARGTVTVKKGGIGRVKVGFRGTDSIPCTVKRGYLEFTKGSHTTFEGGAAFTYGCCLICEGTLTIGDLFFMNVNGMLSCHDRVTIGEDVLLGWNVTIMDSDNHRVFENGKEKETKAPIEIGDHVWICANTTVTKHAKAGNHCIIAQRSYFNRPFEGDHLLIGGYPAKILKENYDWDY